ncbi:MAG TPA: molecular chaperone HtpG, partial [Clostridia bacterium]|nr:molecular chaperone HtpG [Clostridia bacterium]
TSLSEYVKRMPVEQKEIYYLLAPNREAAESSPYFEVFRARGMEVLFMFDPWDEFVMDHLFEFEQKPVKAAEKAEVDLSAEERGGGLTESEAEELGKWMKETLGDRVNQVRVSKRLVGSPAVVLDSDKFMTSTMRRILKAAGKAPAAEAKQDLEINPRHGIIMRLAKERQANAALATQVTEQVLDNALVAAGLLEDPRTMLARLNELLERVLTPTAAK